MLRLLAYLIGKGVATNRVIPELLETGLIGFPKANGIQCAVECSACVDVCPTAAIKPSPGHSSVVVDRGACIACNECVAICPTGTLANDLSVKTFAYRREDLLASALAEEDEHSRGGIFNSSLAVRVVSTGCSACDLELAAANNPIFDMERFGIHVVASPRFADALVITGPVPLAMHEPLLSCYQAMSDPRIVIACGTCAISGGVHQGGYTKADGAGSILPVDIFIPGCPPHPWQLIRGILAGRSLKGKSRKLSHEPPDNNPTSRITTEIKLPQKQVLE